MNAAMVEVGQKRIGFLSSVKSSYITQKKMDAIETVKVSMNEYDEKNLQRETVHD